MTRRAMNRKAGVSSVVLVGLVLVILAIVLPFSAVRAESSIVSLGTGGFTGVYYPAGGSICRLVNNTRADHGIRCSVQSTGGSVDNLQQVRRGQLDLGIAQSDWVYHAFHGSERFDEDGADADLRTLFSLYPEYLTIVARADAGISDLEQLRGKRVSIGKPGSGQRATFEVLLRALGWDLSVFAETPELEPADQARALCDNRIDVMIYTVGHPTGAIKEVTRNCESRLVRVVGPAVERMIAGNPYYHRASIPGGIYAGNPEPVTTLGVHATFFASNRLSEDVAYSLVRAVFENSDQFRRLHPAFVALDTRQMIHGPFSAPLHPGALRYYREAGMVSD